MTTGVVLLPTFTPLFVGNDRWLFVGSFYVGWSPGSSPRPRPKNAQRYPTSLVKIEDQRFQIFPDTFPLWTRCFSRYFSRYKSGSPWFPGISRFSTCEEIQGSRFRSGDDEIQQKSWGVLYKTLWNYNYQVDYNHQTNYQVDWQPWCFTCGCADRPGRRLGISSYCWRNPGRWTQP